MQTAEQDEQTWRCLTISDPLSKGQCCAKAAKVLHLSCSIKYAVNQLKSLYIS